MSPFPPEISNSYMFIKGNMKDTDKSLEDKDRNHSQPLYLEITEMNIWCISLVMMTLKI